MQIPKSKPSTTVIEQYIKDKHQGIENNQFSKTKLKSELKNTLDKNYDYIFFNQNGDKIIQLIIVTKTKNDWGTEALFISPIRIEKIDKKNINNIIRELTNHFPKIPQMTFLLLPKDKKLQQILKKIDFNLDATMLVGNINKTLKRYELTLQESPTNISIKEFNFNRDYPHLKKIKKRDTKYGQGDCRSDFSKKTVRDADFKYWKMICEKKTDHFAFGIWKKNRLIGAISTLCVKQENYSKRIHIADIIIDIQNRGEKLSHYLYRKALEEGKKRKIRIFTGATTTNTVLNAAKNQLRKPYGHFYTKLLQN